MPMLTLTPTSAVPFRILDVPALPPDAPLNPLRVAQLAHEAARLHYSFIKLPVDGCMVYIAARFSPAIHCARLGLSAAPTALRPLLSHPTRPDTATA
jgi:hypothetical protein